MLAKPQSMHPEKQNVKLQTPFAEVMTHMPDWTYQTVFRPILKRMPFPAAQAMAFGTMGYLGRNAVGRAVIRFMGHANPPKAASVVRGNLRFSSPCALGCGIDLSAHAVSALSLFGFGLIEVGPVDVGVSGESERKTTSWKNDGVTIPHAAQVDLDRIVDNLDRNRFRDGTMVVARLRIDEDADAGTVSDVLNRFGLPQKQSKTSAHLAHFEQITLSAPAFWSRRPSLNATKSPPSMVCPGNQCENAMAPMVKSMRD